MATYAVSWAGNTTVSGAVIGGEVKSTGGEISGYSAPNKTWWKLFTMPSNNNDHCVIDIFSPQSTPTIHTYSVSMCARDGKIGFAHTIQKSCKMGSTIPRVVAMFGSAYTETAFITIASAATPLRLVAPCDPWQAQTFTNTGVSKTLSSVTFYPFYYDLATWRPNYYFEFREYDGVVGHEGQGALLYRSELLPTPTAVTYDTAVATTCYFRPQLPLVDGAKYAVYFPDSRHIGLAGRNTTIVGCCFSSGNHLGDGYNAYFKINSTEGTPVVTYDIYVRTITSWAGTNIPTTTLEPLWVNEGNGAAPTSHPEPYIMFDSGDEFNRPLDNPLPYRYMQGWEYTCTSATAITAGAERVFSAARGNSERGNIQYNWPITFSTTVADSLGIFAGVAASSTSYGLYIVDPLTPGVNEISGVAPVLTIVPSGTYLNGWDFRRIGWVRTTSDVPGVLIRTRSVGSGTTKEVHFIDANIPVTAGLNDGTATISYADIVSPSCRSVTLRVVYTAGGSSGSKFSIVPAGTTFTAATTPYAVPYSSAGTSGTVEVPLDSTQSVTWTLAGGAVPPTVSVYLVSYTDTL